MQQSNSARRYPLGCVRGVSLQPAVSLPTLNECQFVQRRLCAACAPRSMPRTGGADADARREPALPPGSVFMEFCSLRHRCCAGYPAAPLRRELAFRMRTTPFHHRSSREWSVDPGEKSATSDARRRRVRAAASYGACTATASTKLAKARLSQRDTPASSSATDAVEEGAAGSLILGSGVDGAQESASRVFIALHDCNIDEIWSGRQGETKAARRRADPELVPHP